MTDDAAAVGEQRLGGWLGGYRGVACPADQVRVTDRSSAVSIFLFEKQASHCSLL